MIGVSPLAEAIVELESKKTAQQGTAGEPFGLRDPTAIGADWGNDLS
jgi:hypothetical protein